MQIGFSALGRLSQESGIQRWPTGWQQRAVYALVLAARTS